MIAGLDFSSRAVHVVLLDDDTPDASPHTFELHGDTPFERARSLRRVFPTRGFWEDHGVYLLGIEDPFSVSLGTAKALGLAAGAIAALLPNQLPVLQTPPGEWKRLFTEDAGANKAQVETRARTLWPDPPVTADHNTFDAYAIAWATRTLNNEAIEKTRVA